MSFCPSCGVDRGAAAPSRPCAACGAAAWVPGAAPSVSASQPIRPRPGSIAFGLAMTVLSVWLLFMWIPSKRPLDPAETVAYAARATAQGDLSWTSEWRLKPDVYRGRT